MDKEAAIEMIQQCFNSLKDSGFLEQEIKVDSSTVIIGNGSILDSIGFVTLVTELEDKLSLAAKKDIFFVLDNIQEFDMNSPYLSADTFAQYMLRLVHQ